MENNKTYIIYYEFSSTAGNHAGMAYLARYLDQNIGEVELVKNVHQEFKHGGYLSRIYAVYVAYFLIGKLKKGDKVFFMEYLSRGTAHQDITAKLLRTHGIKNELCGLVHLAGDHLLELYTKEAILQKLEKLDKVFVFGSSLKNFIEGIGYKKPVLKTFHYVDNVYYKPGVDFEKENACLDVICMGSLKRNYGELINIIGKTPEVNFHVCLGRSGLDHMFAQLPNAKLYGFLEEKDLLGLMQHCNVNLSVLEDTIGSNVITTSLAVGQIQVVSDVGSIRDYCDEENAYFCKTSEDFVGALLELKTNPGKVREMKKNALLKSKQFSKDSFLKKFCELVVKN